MAGQRIANAAWGLEIGNNIQWRYLFKHIEHIFRLIPLIFPHFLIKACQDFANIAKPVYITVCNRGTLPLLDLCWRLEARYGGRTWGML